ncbi:hypothetical protein BH10PSE18_BH10PSE18_45590 [soil metagenome]
MLLVALAYYWLDNTAHELVGTGIFLLLITHNIFNRHWYGRIAKRRREARNVLDAVLTLCLAVAAMALLASSLMISRTAFRILALNGEVTARQIHVLAAYWTVVFVSIHLGLRWQIVMNILRNASGIVRPSAMRSIALRLSAAVIAVHGAQSSFSMGVGGKLLQQMSMDWWDFGSDGAPGFFLHWLSIVGLYASVTHYASKAVHAYQLRR